LAAGARIVPGAKKQHKKYIYKKPLTRAKILCYNFGAVLQTKVFIFGQNKTRIIAGYY
jgi:hypothetical protein